MRMNPRCVACQIKKQDEKIKHESDELKKLRYIKKVLQILGNSGEEETMPWLSNQIEVLFDETFPHAQMPYAKLKKQYNQLMLSMQDELRAKIEEIKDPIAYAIQLAIVGNYIDFGAMSNVSSSFLLELLEKAQSIHLDQTYYQRLLHDLQNAKQVLYICDNCGEVVADKLLLEQLIKHYPNITFTVMVRGDEIINDATMVDAKEVGLCSLCNVIDNGIRLAGTDLNHISKSALDAIHQADFIFSKGQANFETLSDNGLPIYYLLLCKCDLFAERFNLPKFQGVLFYEDKK